MLKSNDLIRLPYTPDLTQAGIDYACRSLPYTYNRMGGSDFHRLRRIVAGKAVELAFWRYLGAQSLPFDNLGSTPFTDPDRYDVGLGGRRCDIKSFQIGREALVRSLHRDPSALLGATALVPQDQVGHWGAEDLFVFVFATAYVQAHQRDARQAQREGQPVCWLYLMPPEWSLPAVWAPLGGLALKTEQDALTVEVGGQDESREFCTEEVALAPGRRRLLQTRFYSLVYLRVSRLPTQRLGVSSSRLEALCLALPNQWGNVWVYGKEIFLTGYIPCAEFRRRSQLLPAGSRVFQYPVTRTANRSLPVAELFPLSDLWDSLRIWSTESVAQ